MSRTRLFLLLILCGILFTNCTRLVYSTDQYLGDMRTKKDVVDYLGLPTQQREGEGITEWLYDYGTISIGGAYSMGSANANVNRYGNSAYGSATGNVSTVSVFSNFQRYVKFTFDARGNTTRYAYQGVDLSKRKKAQGKTIALVIAGVVVIVGLIALGASED